MKTVDFLVVGGGILGLSAALELRQRHPKAAVSVLEKEERCGLHASGRNSGVLHAGFYYSADSLKAKFTREGNALLTEYCLAHGLAVNRCGKLVVAQGPQDLAGLNELLRRGQANGVKLEMISQEDARRHNPRAKTFERALFSPTTSSVDPGAVMAALAEDARRVGIEVCCGERYLGQESGAVKTSRESYSAGYVINCAGLYADVVARDFGFGAGYAILPFKGLYLYSDEPAGSLKTHIYPVPDLRNPFLGVHATVSAQGKIKIGPTAIPALWREHYEGFENFSAREFWDIAWRQAGLFFRAGFDFRRLAVEEGLKQFRPRMIGLASRLMTGVEPKLYRRWGKPGLRAQLLNLKTNALEMDFILEGDKRSMHVLNAVSPGFTCATAFARYLCERIEAA